MGKHVYGTRREGRKTGRFRLLAVSLGVATLASMLSGLPVQPARADPAGPSVYRALSGVGSATTQDLMDALSDVVTVNGQKVLASYKADPGASGTITTKNPATHPDCTLNRPADDAGGQSALGYSLGAENGCLADGAQLVQWPADDGPEKDWTLQTATTVSPGEDTLMNTTTAAATMSSATRTGATAGPAPVGKAAIAAAAANQWVTVTYPKRLIDIRNGRCSFQGYWSQKGVRPGSEPIGGSFLDTRGYLVGPKCAVSMHLQVINYKKKKVGIFVADHYVDAGKPSSPGKPG
ncbi:hypothetical protein [Microtetraspora sp. NBRC 13810]|uniref:hypothetical protein n=1 Tax=Microtetraspora sp. NBRC 13810 TaxID=3030990 RepID=UPI0025554624|nr:hypothetical protein [Microtetraspora sp. NBRC 13810]